MIAKKITVSQYNEVPIDSLIEIDGLNNAKYKPK